MVNYAIVGGGRLARHFSHYFHLLGIRHSCWTRDRNSQLNTSALQNAGKRLKATIADADRVLLLVSDNAIASVLKQYPFLHEKTLIHCSGALSFPGIAGAHPLMTFADDLYALETYQSVPFMLESGHDFDTLLPGLQNPHFPIEVEDKARYHALCVMTGNFAQMLWKGVSGRFEAKLGLPGTSLQPYLKQVLENFVQAPASALTGPHSRNDTQTIERNMRSLDGDPLQDLYAAFTEFYKTEAARSPGLNQIQKGQMK